MCLGLDFFELVIIEVLSELWGSFQPLFFEHFFIPSPSLLLGSSDTC